MIILNKLRLVSYKKITRNLIIKMKTTLNLLKTLIDQSFKGSQTRK